MPNYTYILEKLNCARKHIEFGWNGTGTRVFATIVEDWMCKGCMYKSMCNKVASAVQQKAQLEKDVEVRSDS